ncbi:ATP-binding protein [Vibrio sp. F12]|uniref:AAA family ATPase n=1 Tax=Vibrio sp. F12 TaxID=2070776 RepID=UPI0010BD180A|nr:ATP-binding protein [Vibrio sp. F12]TKE95087.1 ATP-binding protein [Vibrio sp. F12]
MINNYVFQNFQSYLDESHIDFTVNQKAPHSYYDYEMDSGLKIAKVMAVLGANGAGKSNLLKPLSFLAWFIPHSFGGREKGDLIPILPHSLGKGEHTSIEVDFVIPKWNESDEDDRDFEFKYKVILDQDRVIFEELKVKTSRLFSRIFSRELDLDTNKYVVKVNSQLGPDIPISILAKAPKNCSLISYIFEISDDLDISIDDNNRHGLVFLAYSYFQSANSNIVLMGTLQLSENLSEATDFYIEEPEYFDFAKSLIMKYDLGISDIEFEKKIVMDSETGAEEERIIPMCLHRSHGEEFKIPIFLESSGTKSAFCVLATIALSLKTGGIAILDEFDNDFHPQLTMAIVDLFKDDAINRKNAQLLFNTHNAEVLKSLRRQHCYLVEKNEGISDAYRADEIEGLSARDNLYAKYISGSLGATPEFG